MLYLLLVTLEAPGVLRQQKHDKLRGTCMLTLSIDHRVLNETTHVDLLSCCFSHKVSVTHLSS